MWSAGVVGLKIAVEVLLHLVDGLVPGRAAPDLEMLFEQGAVEALDEAARLGPAYHAAALCLGGVFVVTAEDGYVRRAPGAVQRFVLAALADAVKRGLERSATPAN